MLIPRHFLAHTALLALVCFTSAPVTAEQSQNTADKTADIAPAQRFESSHKGSFNGDRLSYRVSAGETYITDGEGQPTASIFSFDYLVDDKNNRPVTFIWNGGPGSSSTWLHMGGYGPKRIVVPSDADHPGAAPYQTKDAPETILDVTDMVFVDPVGTGFSRALGETKKTEFWGLTEDARSIAAFIAQWLTDNKRWNSPLFLLGESFGTTRAAAVANVLLNNHVINVNGIIFVSQALDYQGSTPYVDDNIISYVTYIPTMAATAWYHGKVDTSGDFEAFIEQSRQFATNDLLPALFKGNRISEQERQRIVAGLKTFTGLSEDYINNVNLRINGYRFAKQLLRDKGIAVGRLDSRYIKDERDDVAAGPGEDASSSISPAYKSALMHYMQHDLNINWNRKYLNPADPELSDNWRWRPVPDGQGWEPAYVNTAHDLADVLRSNPSLRVMVASGYYDLVTPFFDAEYTLNRHGISADRIDYLYYHGGHMMYVNEPSRVALLKDTRAFIKAQLAR
ncbi:S10 family peptidase [Aestuariibacter salexigens]|uniref:S10 family peptidase n=1 Tax=Aestuariibacter salexigens TaxID=226010 RepID=UPI0003FB3E2A|nr:serine carboxypeptidase [Aestuariibacter salexigens]